jgi:hypothetical protein
MKISRRMVVGILLAGLVLAAGFLLRSVILENFVRPVALLLWVVNRLLASVDQVVYWVGLILAALFITLSRIAARPMDLGEIHYTAENATLQNMNQWRALILLTRDETDRPNPLRQSLASLLKNVYASKQPNQVPWEVNEALERGDIPLPEPIRAFLMIHQAQNTRPSWLQRVRHISQLPSRWVRHWTGQDVTDYYSSIAEVISFMEKQLESDDDE